MPYQQDELKRLAYSEYWDERYAEVGPNEQVHEWLRSFKDLMPFFQRFIFSRKPSETNPKILHLGSGDSTIPEDFSKLGYRNQVCVDFSTVVVNTMSLKHKHIPGIGWQHSDIRNMTDIASESIDVAFDKSTLDAMTHGSPWDPPDDVVENTGRYIREVYRVLKPDGVFICVTYRQPHFVKPQLQCDGVDWEVNVELLAGPESSFGYSGFVLTKGYQASTTTNRGIV